MKHLKNLWFRTPVMAIISGCIVHVSTSAVRADSAVTATDTNAAYLLPMVTITAPTDQSVPQFHDISLTILSGDDIAPGAISEVRDLPAIAPNVSVFDANNNRMPKFSVRGLRENNFTAGDPVVSLYIDDIPYSDMYSRGLQLYNVQQVEIMRGPQETLFGASSPGGAINVRTRQPGNDWHGYGTFSYGNYNDQTYQGGISGAIVTNNLFIGVDGLFSQRDGFVNNLHDNTHPDFQNTLAGRGQLRWTPNDALEFSLLSDASRYHDGFIPTFNPAVDPGPFNVNRDFDGFNNTKNYNEAFKAAFHNEDVKVTSVTTYRYWKQNLAQDFDFSPLPDAVGFSQPALNQWAQEIRAQSADASNPLQWLGGFYFQDQTLHSISGSTLPSGVDIPLPPTFFPPTFIPGPLPDTTFAQFHNQDYALFGQASYSIMDLLDIIGGVRLEYDHRAMNRQENNALFTALGGPQPANLSLSDNFKNVLPKAGLVYHITQDQSAYFNVAEGFQPGGFNQSSQSPALARYGSANSWNLELGYKSSWCDNKLTSRVASFYNFFHDYQTYDIDPADPTQATLLNAPKAHSVGAELELEAQPCDAWQFSLAAGYCNARYDNFTDPLTGKNLDGATITFVPQFTANLAAQYNFLQHFYARAELEGVGKYYETEDNAFRQSAYGLLNARIGCDYKYWGVYVYGRNLLDKTYANNALDLRSAQTPGLVVYQPGDPVTFGVALTAKF